MKRKTISLAFGGDVMTGRGIDQILPHPCDPTLHEGYLKSAEGYVEIAEEKNGPIPRQVGAEYIWGDSLVELERRDLDARIVNLETSVTTSDHWVDKGINYRMNPKNIECLRAAKITCVSLANNHILDWGEEGLAETLETLRQAGIQPVGAGRNIDEAQMPAILDYGPRGRVLIFAFGLPSSGVPASWAASPRRPGVSFLPDLSSTTTRRLMERIAAYRWPGDSVVVSIHWGANWGYEISKDERNFAHALMDGAGVDVIHGHSSHHLKKIEVYQGRPIFYGCGDLITDYEGIGGYESYRGDLGIWHVVRIDRDLRVRTSIEMIPFKMRRFRLEKLSSREIHEFNWARSRAA